MRTRLSSYGSLPVGTHMHSGARDFPLPDTYYKFAIYRNPWERMVSIYLFTNGRFNESPERYRHVEGFSQKDWSFEDWLLKGELWEGNFRKFVIPPVQKRSQTYYTHAHGGEQMVDYIGRFEELDAICSHLESELKIILDDGSIRDTIDQVDYKSFYNQATIDHIAQYFSWEIEHHGYTI